MDRKLMNKQGQILVYHPQFQYVCDGGKHCKRAQVNG